PHRASTSSFSPAWPWPLPCPDHDQPFLFGPTGGTVPPLVIANDLQHTGPVTVAPAPPQPPPAYLLERSAHLLHRHLRVFPPAAAACARRRRPTRPNTGSDAVATLRSSCPRSG